MLYHNEPPNGNGKSQPNRNIVDDNTEIRENIAKYNGLYSKIGVVHKLRWQVFGFFGPPIPPRLYFLPYKSWPTKYPPTSSCELSLWTTPYIYFWLFLTPSKPPKEKKMQKVRCLIPKKSQGIVKTPDTSKLAYIWGRGCQNLVVPNGAMFKYKLKVGILVNSFFLHIYHQSKSQGTPDARQCHWQIHECLFADCIFNIFILSR